VRHYESWINGRMVSRVRARYEYELDESRTRDSMGGIGGRAFSLHV